MEITQNDTREVTDESHPVVDLDRFIHGRYTQYVFDSPIKGSNVVS